MPWYSPIMTTAQLLYRDYLIELEHDAQGWRAIAITHSVRGATIYPRGSTILTGPAQNDMRRRLLTHTQMLAGGGEGLINKPSP
jgi:hypothetical protein